MSTAPPPSGGDTSIGRRAQGIIGESVDRATYIEKQINISMSPDAAGSYLELPMGQGGRGQPVPTIPRLLPYLVNRREQEEAFEDSIGAYLEAKSKQPFVYVIRGEDQECPRNLPERIRLHLLPRTKTISPNGQPFQKIDIPWPGEIKDPATLKQRLWREISKKFFNHRAASQDEIKQYIRKYDQGVVLVLELLTENFHHRGRQLFEELIAFWKDWLRSPSEPHLVVLICINYQYVEQRRHSTARRRKISIWLPFRWDYWKMQFTQWRRRRVQSRLDRSIHLFERMSLDQINVHFAAMPVLQPIPRSEAERWTMCDDVIGFLTLCYSREPNAPGTTDDFIDQCTASIISRIKALYQDREERYFQTTIPMDELGVKLTTFLVELLA